MIASKFIGAKAADDDHIPMIQPETGGASGPGPAFRQFSSIGDEIAYATRPGIANRRRRQLVPA